MDDDLMCRALLKVIRRDKDRLRVLLPGRDTKHAFWIPLEAVPGPLQWAAHKDARFIVWVNLAARHLTDLRFEEWQVAPSPEEPFDLELVLERLPGYFAAIEEGVSEGDFAKAVKAAHALRHFLLREARMHEKELSHAGNDGASPDPSSSE
ncbi:MAG TPA: hypothetical protein VFA07_19785 [Chthonomonadaceae bacterium]|nr:hypothetical protein [Chthonomonadaceae bacterium]